jgi:septal ring factor EnvC (AmiA/AmiB activator)
VSTEPTPRDPALELLDRLRDEASQHVGRELDDLRAHLIKCCEHSIERLRKCGFVSLESVTSVVVALTEVAASERDRANRLSNLLKSTEAELEGVRATREAQVELEQELQDARETAARAAEAQRAEFATSRNRLQHVIDAQSLELIELRRVLEKANRGAPAVRPPALDAGRPARSPRERLAETLPFDAIDAALSATPPVTDWPRAG